jgi:hypothetical protein
MVGFCVAHPPENLYYSNLVRFKNVVGIELNYLFLDH